MKLDIVGAGYLGRSSNINASRSVNFYPEIGGSDGKSIAALIGTPGTSLFTDTGLGVIRGMHVFNSVMYVVAGGKLYSVANDGTLSAQLGNDLVTSSGRIVMTNNGLSPTGGNELAITDGQRIYIWDVGTSTFTTVAVAAHTICFISGYFVADIGGGRWQVSDLYDGTTWGTANISTADGAPDDLLTVFNNHGELWLFGEYTTEVWYSSGVGSPPFARQSGGVIDYGCVAKYSVAKGNNSVFWLGTRRNNDNGEFIGVCVASGYGVEVISPASINYLISQYSTISDAFGYCYTEGGHEFYILTFPTANATWAFDSTTGFWHERSTYVNDPYVVGRHLGNCYAYFNNKHYVGDYQTGKIYRMDSSYYSEYGNPIVSFRTCPYISDGENLNDIFIHKLQIDAETGVGDLAAPLHHVALSAAISLSNSPTGIIYAGGYIWVSNYISSGTVLKIDPDTNAIVATITGFSYPYGLTYDGTYIWVANSTKASRIDLTTNTITANVNVGTGAYGITYGGGFIWVVNGTAGTVTKFDPLELTTTWTITVGTNPNLVTYGNGYVWVGNYSSNTVTKINAVTNAIAATISVGTSPYGVVYHDGYVWVSNFGTDSVSKINATTDAIVSTVYLSSRPYGIATDGSYIWVNIWGTNITAKIDPVANTVLATVAVGSAPHQITYGNGYIWVTNYTSKTISKIQPSIEAPSVDPTAFLSWSDDGGHIWIQDKPAALGKQGEYRTRLIWRRLGRSESRVFRIAISDSIKKVLLASYIEASGGA